MRNKEHFKVREKTGEKERNQGLKKNIRRTHISVNTRKYRRKEGKQAIATCLDLAPGFSLVANRQGGKRTRN